MRTKVLIPLYLSFILMIVFSCENETMDVLITDMEITLSSEILEVGYKDTIEVLISPANLTGTEFVWTSSEPSIAEVNADGILTGISPGVTIITVSTKDNKYSASDTVQVIRWTYYSMEDVHIRPITIDSENNIWCGGIELTRIIDNQQTVYPNIKNISAIAVDDAGTKWFGTYHSGVWKYDGSIWTNFSESNSDLAYNSINYSSMMHDHNGNLWVGTVSNDGRGTGVTMYDGNQWSVFNSDNGLVNNAVQKMAIDHQGNKWFTTFGGISSYDDSNWVSYTSENTGIKLIDQVFSIAIDSKNNKWFGSYKGALKFDGKNWTVYNISYDNMKWSFINAIAVDKNDNLWFATEYHVAKFDGKKWINYPSANGQVYNVRAISIDSEGNKWLGTSNGVIKLED